MERFDVTQNKIVRPRGRNQKEPTMKRTMLLLLSCLLMAGGAAASTVVYSDNLVNETSLAVDTNYNLDVGGMDNVSAMVTASSATIANVAFDDGRAATGSFTIASLTDLTTAFASDKLTILSTNSLSGAIIRLGSIPFIEGKDWHASTTKALTATTLAAGLNTKFAGIIVSTAPTSSVIVYSTAVVAGSAANSYTFTSDNSSITVNAATFTGGKDNAWIMIGSTKLTFNVNVGVGASTALTAQNLMTAINADATLSTIVISTATGGSSIVRTTATAVGTGGNYSLVSSTPTAIVPSGMVMTGGLAADYTIAQSSINAPSHGMSTGFFVYFTTGTNVALNPLVHNTTYYVIKVDANTVKLALTQAAAVAGTPIVFTSSRTPTTTNTYTIVASTAVGTPSYKWRVSNDNTYWVDLSTRTNATGVVVEQGSLASYALAGTSMAWDLGKVGYRYLRFAVTAPTRGAIWIKNAVIGKRN